MINKKNNYLNNFVLVNKFNENWNILFNFFILYFKQYKYSELLINFIKSIQSNKNIFLLFFIFASWFWSNFLLRLIYIFVLTDSIIISLLVLQNNSINHNSRRLCKNIILIAFTNFIGGIFTLVMILFVYLEYSKLINRILFKIIKFMIKLIAYIFPPIYLLYPDIKLFNFDDPDNTIEEKFDYKNIKNFKYKNKDKNQKKFKKLKINNILSNNVELDDYSLSSKSKKKSTFPTISTIDSKIIKDKLLKDKLLKDKIKNIKLSKKKINHQYIKNKFDKSDKYDNNELNILNKFGFEFEF
jgi:hypothetical protein